MMKMIKTNYNFKKEKQKKETEMRLKKFKDSKVAEEMRRLKRQKELKKKICRTISKMDSAKQAENSTGKHRGKK